MDTREEMTLSGSSSFHLTKRVNGSGSASGGFAAALSGLPTPPGFMTLTNPNISVQKCNLIDGSGGSKFQVENPSPNTNDQRKRKRGRPRKSGPLGITPKRGRGRPRGSGRKQKSARVANTNFRMLLEQAEEPPPPPSAAPQQPAKGADQKLPVTVYLTFEEETKPKIDPLSTLKPPPPRPCPQNQLTPEILKQSSALVPGVRSYLVSNLTLTNSVDKMIELANRAFETLDWLHDDYRPFHSIVYDFIHYHSKCLAAENEKGHFIETINRQEELVVHSNNALEACDCAKDNLNKAMQQQLSLTKQIADAKELLSKLEKEFTDREMEVENLRAEYDRCAEAYSNTEDKVRRIGLRVDEAKKMLEEIDQRQEAAMKGIEETRDQLMSFI